MTVRENSSKLIITYPYMTASTLRKSPPAETIKANVEREMLGVICVCVMLKICSCSFSFSDKNLPPPKKKIKAMTHKHRQTDRYACTHLVSRFTKSMCRA